MFPYTFPLGHELIRVDIIRGKLIMSIIQDISLMLVKWNKFCNRHLSKKKTQTIFYLPTWLQPNVESQVGSGSNVSLNLELKFIKSMNFVFVGTIVFVVSWTEPVLLKAFESSVESVQDFEETK